VVDAYSRLLNDPDPVVRQRAADAWCLWESATIDYPPSNKLSPRFTNPDFARAFARLVTHYISHNVFLEDGVLLRRADVLANTPAILINGRYDFQAPIANAFVLHQALPRSEMAVVDNAAHAASNSGITQELIRATDHFAR
jgi:proline iminopeptidase